MEERWNASSLPFERITPEEEWKTLVGHQQSLSDNSRLNNNTNRVAYRIDDRVFDPEELMRCCLNRITVNQRVGRHSIVSGEAIELVLDDPIDDNIKRSVSVVVQLCQDKKTVRVHPKTCVLAAGLRNESHSSTISYSYLTVFRKRELEDTEASSTKS